VREAVVGMGEDDVLAEGAVVFEVGMRLADVLEQVYPDRSEAGGASGELVQVTLQHLLRTIVGKLLARYQEPTAR
jgi:hypothetical protein